MATVHRVRIGGVVTARIRKNAWDNWYGYLGNRKVISFCNTPTETQEEQAIAWLHEQQKGPVVRPGTGPEPLYRRGSIL